MVRHRAVPQELDAFLKTLAKNLGEAIQHDAIPKDYLSSNRGNRESVLHARVLAILAKTGFDLEYVVEIESGFSPREGRLFRPDLQLWRSDHHSFLVEYESTNSSDSTILRKDLNHYIQSQTNESFPDFWLIVYTLPKKPVDKWTSWDYRRKWDTGFIKMKANPHKHYKAIFENPNPIDRSLPNILKYTDSNSAWQERQLFLINLSDDGLEIDYPTNFGNKYSFR